VFALGHQKTVWNLRRDVDHVSRGQRVSLSAVNPRTFPFPDAIVCFRVLLWVDDFAAQQQCGFTVLHNDDIDLVVMLLGIAIPVSIEQSKTMALVIR